MPRSSALSASPKEMILKTLRKNKAPMSAYALLEKLKASGVNSPPTVYRALEALGQTGEVHKIHALNAFVACNCESDHAHSTTLLTICQECSEVEELHNHAVIEKVEAMRELGVKLTSHAVIELPITCARCT